MLPSTALRPGGRGRARDPPLRRRHRGGIMHDRRAHPASGMGTWPRHAAGSAAPGVVADSLDHLPRFVPVPQAADRAWRAGRGEQAVRGTTNRTGMRHASPPPWGAVPKVGQRVPARVTGLCRLLCGPERARAWGGVPYFSEGMYVYLWGEIGSGAAGRQLRPRRRASAAASRREGRRAWPGWPRRAWRRCGGR